MKSILKIIIPIILLASGVSASNLGKTSLSGKITDITTNEPIFGVTIFIPELKTGAISMFDGSYKIDNLPQTKVLLQITCIGYKTILVTIDLNMTNKRDFKMEPSIKEINTFVVTGTSQATELKRNPVPVSVVDRISISQSASTNAIDLIAKQPGVNAVTTGPNVSKPFIRGLGFNRVLTLFDGVRQEGQQWGDEHGIEVDESAIDRVEVIKGPESLIYGSDAIAGVVNLIPAAPVPDGVVKSEIISNYQTNNGLYLLSGSNVGNIKGFVFSERVSYKAATNYHNLLDGRVYGTAFREYDINGYIGITKHWGYTHLNYAIFDDNQQIPDGSRDSAGHFTKQIAEEDTIRQTVSPTELKSYTISALHQHVQHYKLYSTSNFILGDGKLSIILGYQDNIRREFSHPQFIDIPGLYLVLQTGTYDVKYYLPIIHGWNTTVGINGMYQNNKNKGTEFIIPNYNLFDVGPFIYTKKIFGPMDISAGIRYDNRSFGNDVMFTVPNIIGNQIIGDKQVNTVTFYNPFKEYSHSFSGISGSFGLTYNFTEDFLIKANIARGFRAPNIAEISANGVHPGSNIYQMGNPDFKPEFSLQEDFGIFYSTKHVSASVEVFNNDITNYIFNQKLLNDMGQDSVIVQGNQTFKFAQSEARLYGGEASIDIHPHPLDWLHFENSLSVVYALNKGGDGIVINDSNKYLPFIPPIHTHSELKGTWKKMTKLLANTYLKIEMEWYNKQDRIYSAYGTETITPGYILYGAGVGGDVTNKSGKTLFSVNIVCTNITDVAYQSNLSRLKYFTSPGFPNGIYNMGRNISFKVVIPIDIKSPKATTDNQ